MPSCIRGKNISLQALLFIKENSPFLYKVKITNLYKKKSIAKDPII
jgi:hypothetical protein